MRATAIRRLLFERFPRPTITGMGFESIGKTKFVRNHRTHGVGAPRHTHNPLIGGAGYCPRPFTPNETYRVPEKPVIAIKTIEKSVSYRAIGCN